MFPNIAYHSKQHSTTRRKQIISRTILKKIYTKSCVHNFSRLFRGPLLLILYLASMSTYYQVMGAVRCPKIKKHAGIKLRLEKKEPYMPRDLLIYTCESAGYTQTIKCMDDGRWSEQPHCPDPSNFTCPDLPPLSHGISNSTGPPYKVGSVVAFKCDTESFPNAPNLPSTFATTKAPDTTSATTAFNDQFISDIKANSSENKILATETQPLRYNLSGHRLLKCLPSSKWNHEPPLCNPIYPEQPSQVSLFLTSTLLIMVPILIFIVAAQLVIRWRKRQQQRERWKQYFTDYKYRHSKTSITFGLRPNSTATTIPVTDL